MLSTQLHTNTYMCTSRDCFNFAGIPELASRNVEHLLFNDSSILCCSSVSDCITYVRRYRAYNKGVHIRIHTYIHTYIPNININTQVRTYIRTYMHTYIYTYVCTCTSTKIHYIKYRTWENFGVGKNWRIW